MSSVPSKEQIGVLERQRRSASRIIESATRSLAEPAGFCASSLARSAAVMPSALAKRESESIGVLPISSATEE